MNTLRRSILMSVALLGAFAFPALAADANVAGTWTMNVESSLGSGTPVFTLTQTGNEIAGTYAGAMGEVPVKGTVKGNAVEIKYTINAQGVELTVTYSGTVEANTMKGKISYGDMGEGTFTGKKS